MTEGCLLNSAASQLRLCLSSYRHGRLPNLLNPGKPPFCSLFKMHVLSIDVSAVRRWKKDDTVQQYNCNLNAIP